MKTLEMLPRHRRPRAWRWSSARWRTSGGLEFGRAVCRVAGGAPRRGGLWHEVHRRVPATPGWLTSSSTRYIA